MRLRRNGSQYARPIGPVPMLSRVQCDVLVALVRLDTSYQRLADLVGVDLHDHLGYLVTPRHRRVTAVRPLKTTEQDS